MIIQGKKYDVSSYDSQDSQSLHLSMSLGIKFDMCIGSSAKTL